MLFPRSMGIGVFSVVVEVCEARLSMSVWSSLWDWISRSWLIIGSVVVVMIDPNMMRMPITRMNPRGITDPCVCVCCLLIMCWLYVCWGVLKCCLCWCLDVSTFI